MPIPLDAWRERGRYMQLREHRIFVVDTGPRQGTTIVLIHGFPTASWDWSHIWTALERSHRLVALDLLGFGFSDKPAGHRYSIMEQADICEALVDALGLERFHVLAHDYGDTVAQELLARQNQGTGRGSWLSLCLLNGGLFPETHQPRLIQKLLLSPLGPLVARLASRRQFDRSMSAVFGDATKPGRDELDGFWRLLEFNGGRKSSYRLITYICRAGRELRFGRQLHAPGRDAGCSDRTRASLAENGLAQDKRIDAGKQNQRHFDLEGHAAPEIDRIRNEQRNTRKQIDAEAEPGERQPIQRSDEREFRLVPEDSEIDQTQRPDQQRHADRMQGFQ